MSYSKFIIIIIIIIIIIPTRNYFSYRVIEIIIQIHLK